VKTFFADVLGPTWLDGRRTAAKWAVTEESYEAAIQIFVAAVPRGSEVTVSGATVGGMGHTANVGVAVELSGPDDRQQPRVTWQSKYASTPKDVSGPTPPS
jgi:hypothetical protein